MKHDRLHALTDGIFAIVMTLLVLDIKVPNLPHPNNSLLIHSLVSQYSIFASYLISFAVLFIYWRSHNFIVSIVAKNIDNNLVNINMLFLFLVGLVPYSTHFFGQFPDTQVGIAVYALNIISIGLTLFCMRVYVEKAETIETDARDRDQKINGVIRIMVPVICAALAIVASFWSTFFALLLLLFAVVFNFFGNAAEDTRAVLRFLGISRRP